LLLRRSVMKCPWDGEDATQRIFPILKLYHDLSA
jgi:hypothetical protein